MRLIDADKLKQHYKWWNNEEQRTFDQIVDAQPAIDAVPVVRCRECRWWDKIGDSPIGYCHACKHGYCSSHWEISIHRTYKGDFFCADGKRKDGAE